MPLSPALPPGGLPGPLLHLPQRRLPQPVARKLGHHGARGALRRHPVQRARGVQAPAGQLLRLPRRVSPPSRPPPPKKNPSQRDYITLFSCLPPAQRFRTSVYPVSPQNLSPRTATDPTCAPERVGKVLVVHSFVRGGGKARQPGELKNDVHPETLPRAARFNSAGCLAAGAVPPSLPAPRPVGTGGVGP